jgi:DNA-directed RNA polymerase I, II, and III subunit RPABC1|uniref:RNA polymerase subunit H/Rpb5 C-terminal domain-containing protein n=1 Tax=viral metagenome TaxID=1070528 RepID=A0A6C0CE59_9ZZZZ
MSNSTIISIYNSRKNLLEILEERGFSVANYSNFSITDVGILTENNQLDMLLENSTINKKIYVKYYVTKLIKPQNIYDIVEDLFHLESILEKKDDLMIVIKDEPNDTLLENIKDIWTTDKIYISLVNIKRLQFNILKHTLVPKHTILSDDEKELFMKKYNILDNSQIPDISYFSPVSIVIGLRPDNVVKIERTSRTSITSDFYRICKIY